MKLSLSIGLIASILIVLGCSWFSYPSDPTHTLYNPYDWVQHEAAFGVPSLAPNWRDISYVPDRYAYSMEYPAGYVETRIIPEHLEICVYGKDNSTICTSI